jgi:hypothetical protein
MPIAKKATTRPKRRVVAPVYPQHRGALQRSIGDSGNVLDTSSRRTVKMIAATIWRNLVRFRLKTRHNRPRSLRLLALPE